MITLHLENEPAATSVKIKNEMLIVELEDGRTIMIPLSWYPRLMSGSSLERKKCKLLGDGYAIEWPDLDEHIGIEGLLAGRRSGESQKSLNRWLSLRRPAQVEQKRATLRQAQGPPRGIAPTYRPQRALNHYMYVS